MKRRLPLTPLQTCDSGGIQLAAIHYEKVAKTANTPDTWLCHYQCCDTTSSLWLCLECGNCFCRNLIEEAESHMDVHFTRKEHSLFMELNTAQHRVFCCREKAFAGNDNARGDVFLIRKLLRQVQELEDDERRTRTSHATTSSIKCPSDRWRMASNFAIRLKYFHPRMSARRRKFDAAYTAVFKWKHSVLVKCFNSWRESKSKSTPMAAAVHPRFHLLERQNSALFPGKTGLRNLGNTCYLNATLQALCHLVAFRKYITTYRNEARLHSEIRKVFHELCSGKLAAYSPDTMVSTVWDLFPMFSGFKQQDSDELLRNILWHLDNEQSDVSPSGVISRLFRGKLQTEIVCAMCSTSSVSRDEILGVLSVSIPMDKHCLKRSSRLSTASCSLDDCLYEMLKPETMSADSQYFCDKCKEKQDATRTLKFDQLPSCLILQVIRGAWGNGTKKVQTHVKFRLHKFSLNVEGEISQCYNLRAVVKHDGGSLTEGHYTAFGWNDSLQTWLHFNDHKVKPVPESFVEAQQAYLLFYALE